MQQLHANPVLSLLRNPVARKKAISNIKTFNLFFLMVFKLKYELQILNH